MDQQFLQPFLKGGAFPRNDFFRSRQPAFFIWLRSCFRCCFSHVRLQVLKERTRPAAETAVPPDPGTAAEAKTMFVNLRNQM